MPTLIKILLVVLSFAAMEAVAWATHKYVMHGWLWSWHRDHHVHSKGFFEKNDLFGIFFSLLAMGFIFSGLLVPYLWPLFYIGLGVTAYGMAYFVFHDIIVHKRLKHQWQFKGRYMRRIIKVHKVHHKYLQKDGAEAFGFLYAGKHFDQVVDKERSGGPRQVGA
ncbi:MAG: sterol desaturase family protein [Bacteroidetes bacterium]|nr:sterol desaturase family protein [Bacteroidota bacterium]